MSANIAAHVAAYHAEIDVIVNEGNADQTELENALAALETNLLADGMDRDAVETLLDELFENA